MWYTFNIMNSKTKQLLIYIAKQHPDTSVTSFMKLCYLIDLVSVKKTAKQITDFEYRRYNYGPFDDTIYEYLNTLVKEGVFSARNEYTSRGDDFIVYSLNQSYEEKEGESLAVEDMAMVDEVLEAVKGFGAKTLTEIAYKTKPMVALNATLGGNENMNQVLNLAI